MNKHVPTKKYSSKFRDIGGDDAFSLRYDVTGKGKVDGRKR